MKSFKIVLDDSVNVYDAREEFSKIYEYLDEIYWYDDIEKIEITINIKPKKRSKKT
jgi:hypothetical protein